ncbi:MAG: hypothetical protein WB510_08845 [Candidatus Sulfotelmatobacter sp.]
MVSASTGQGVLTLITNNAALGVAGIETLGVQFANTNHALIMQFDGTATSSGSMDLQTATSAPSGGFAFAFSGVDKNYFPKSLGGVFTITGGTTVNGVVDENDAGTVSTNSAFSGTLSAPDAFGRGTLTITGSGSLINYYIVGAEVIRIIDVDTNQSNVGSAFGQGAGSFTNASLGSSVFATAGNPFSSQNGAVGQLSTNAGAAPATFAGVGEDNELGNAVASALASAISGTYTIAASGYGSLTITNAGLGDVSALGIYMTDPALNLNDPNNATGGGGALVLDLDAALAGTTGVLIPQTDTTAASFAGNYAVGWQNFNEFSACSLCEFDMVTQGSMTAGGALSLTGDVSDPFFTLGLGGSGLYGASTFTGTPQADGVNPGRYSMLQSNGTPNPLGATINSVSVFFDVVMYQASGGQLFWLEYDVNSVLVGPLQQQGSLTGLPAAKKAVAKAQAKHKQ